MPQYVFHSATSRGHANHGWLDSYHTFSFANYHDPARMHFGMLRVLNDDTIEGAKGFGAHPHDNMEIITIPLKGALAHKDNTGRSEIIKANDVQIMSAGTGIMHSEFNASQDDAVSLLQIWVFPKVRNIKPRYDQKTFNTDDRKNKIQTVVAPDESGAININQDAWFSLSSLEKDFSIDYTIRKSGNGVYAFVINGALTIDNYKLAERDGLGVWNTGKISIKANEKAELLLIDVPMN